MIPPTSVSSVYSVGNIQALFRVPHFVCFVYWLMSLRSETWFSSRSTFAFIRVIRGKHIRRLANTAETCSLPIMAWRIDENVTRGEIDNRIPGRVTGRIWFVGREDPVVLTLIGNAW